MWNLEHDNVVEPQTADASDTSQWGTVHQDNEYAQAPTDYGTAAVVAIVGFAVLQAICTAGLGIPVAVGILWWLHTRENR